MMVHNIKLFNFRNKIVFYYYYYYLKNLFGCWTPYFFYLIEFAKNQFTFTIIKLFFNFNLIKILTYSKYLFLDFLNNYFRDDFLALHF